ncbi:MAG: mitochondrial fission ELM1 family protein [Pseudomonadota bacterium]
MTEKAVSTPVWCLLGKKAGDNTQVRALARELALDFEEKNIVARPWELLVHVLPGSSGTLAGIDTQASNALGPPWPDLVITAGRRSEQVALWIRQQSGGQCRLVHLGRPWAAPAVWDLVVTTPQYFLPSQSNVVLNALPLHRPDPMQRQDAAEYFGAHFQHLPRPWIAVLAGGDSGQFVFTAEKASSLATQVESMAESCGGSLLVTDSPRTPMNAVSALQAGLRRPHYYYHCGSGEGNPYQALLAMADAFVVTGESMSMLGEAADTGCPLYIFDLADDPDTPWWKVPHQYRYKPLSHRLAMQLAPRRMRRDIGRIQDGLVEAGRAQWLKPGELKAAGRSIALREPRNMAVVDASACSDPGPAGPGLASQDLARAVEAVRRLLK